MASPLRLSCRSGGVFSDFQERLSEFLLRQHRAIASAAFAGSLAPILQFEKLEIHTVFLRFPNLILEPDISPNALAELCGIALSFDATFVLPCAVLQNFFWAAGQSCKKNGNTLKWGYPIQKRLIKAEVPEMLLCSFSLLLGGIGVPKHKVIWQTQDPFFAPAFSFS